MCIICLQGPNTKTRTRHALDCGAGIGRVSKLLLTQHFEKVDMVELSQEFLAKAPEYLGERATKIDRYICCGLQDFIPEEGRYDVIWCQWVLGHLTDDHLIAFFRCCQRGLAENGLIVVKENICAAERKDFDEQDSSFTRPKAELLDLFERAGLQLLKQEKQKQFPKELYEVWMFALK